MSTPEERKERWEMGNGQAFGKSFECPAMGFGFDLSGSKILRQGINMIRSTF